MNPCIELIKREACTGCNACMNVCPEQAIIMETDLEGFWYPTINQKACTQCGACMNTCPIIHTSELREPKKGLDALREKDVPPIYAAWSLDPEIRYHSASGGIFSELAQLVLARGGYVCGAIYDERHMIKHAIIDKAQDLPQVRQSKYAQSDMGDIYKQVGILLNQGKKLLFCGAPCQCAGLSLYCNASNIDIDNLYLVDFICRGANSPKVYRKFLDELESKYNSQIRKVWFKNKSYGWNWFSTRIEFEDGDIYLQDLCHDAYIKGYIEANLFIRPSCSECRFKGFNRVSDLTLADFWGVQINDSAQDVDAGISMVMVHTEKGKFLWDSIVSQVYNEEKSLEEMVRGNVCFYNSALPGAHRGQFMEDLDKMPVIENILRFFNS